MPQRKRGREEKEDGLREIQSSKLDKQQSSVMKDLLQSNHTSEKAQTAAFIIASVASNSPGDAGTFAHMEVVQHLMTMVGSSETRSVLSASGALHNLATAYPSILDLFKMCRPGVLAVIIPALEALSSTLLSPFVGDNNDAKLVKKYQQTITAAQEACTNITALLTHLSERFDAFTTELTQNGQALQLLLNVQVAHATHPRLACEVGALLMTLSENNAGFVPFLQATGALKIISSWISSEQLTLRCCMASIVLNVAASQEKVSDLLPELQALVQTSLELILNILTYDLMEITKQFWASLLEQRVRFELEMQQKMTSMKLGPEAASNMSSMEETSNDITSEQQYAQNQIEEMSAFDNEWLSTVLEPQFFTWKDAGQATRIALEVMTNIFTSIDEKTRTTEVALEIYNGFTAQLQDIVTQCANKIVHMPFTTLVQQLQSDNVTKKVFPEASYLSTIQRYFSVVRRRAMACLFNITIHTEDGSILAQAGLGPETPIRTALVQETLTLSTQLITRHSNLIAQDMSNPGASMMPPKASDLMVIEDIHAAISLLSGLLRNVVDDTSASLVINNNAVKTLSSLARYGPREDVRISSIVCIVAIAQHPNASKLNFILGGTLLEILSQFEKKQHQTGLSVVCEAVDGLMEMYSEDKEHTQTIISLKILDKMASVGPLMEQYQTDNSMIQQHAYDVLQNLQAFLEYKPAHV